MVILFVNFSANSKTGRYVRIIASGKKIDYPLNENRVIKVSGPLGTTTIIVKNGTAWIENSPCREKICMKMGRIKRPGQQAICVPNRVMIEIIGGQRYIDAVSY